MKVTPLQLAAVSRAIYQDFPPGSKALKAIITQVNTGEPVEITFDYLWNYRGTVAGHTMIGTEHVIAYRGSYNLLDWFRNIEAAPIFHPQLGMVHPGFFTGVSDIVIAGMLIGGLEWSNTAVIGHSLGASRAADHAGLCAAAGTPVGLLCMFAPAKPAFVNMRRILEKSNTPILGYTNRNDIVPNVPMLLPWWSHVADLVRLDSPASADDLFPLRDHHMDRYLDGLVRLARGDLPNPAHDALVFGSPQA